MSSRSLSSRGQVITALVGLTIVVMMAVAAAYGAIHNPGEESPSEGASSTKAVPGGVWISPVSSGFDMNGNTLYLAARAYPTNDTDPPIDHVNFTATWPGLGTNRTILCSPSQPVPGHSDWYERTLNLNKVRLPRTGQLTIDSVHSIIGRLAP
jgi:hypothetical protein